MNELVPTGHTLRQLELLSRREPKPPRSLIDSVQRWDRLIDKIGTYRGSLADEYLNDLGARSHVALWLDFAAEDGLTELLAWILPIVDELDARYITKSRLDHEASNWDYNRLNPNWWWLRRLPEDEGLLRDFGTRGPGRRSAPPDLP